MKRLALWLTLAAVLSLGTFGLSANRAEAAYYGLSACDFGTTPTTVAVNSSGVAVWMNVTPVPSWYNADRTWFYVEGSFAGDPLDVSVTGMSYANGASYYAMTTAPWSPELAGRQYTLSMYAPTMYGWSGTKTGSALCTITFTYASAPQYEFAGFKQPLLAPVQSFNLGSTIPVKFSVTSNGAATGVPLAEVYANGALMGTARYDTIEQQYVFNLQTKSMAVGPLVILVKLDNDAGHSINVTLK